MKYSFRQYLVSTLVTSAIVVAICGIAEIIMYLWSVSHDLTILILMVVFVAQVINGARIINNVEKGDKK